MSLLVSGMFVCLCSDEMQLLVSHVVEIVLFAINRFERCLCEGFTISGKRVMRGYKEGNGGSNKQ